MLRCKTNKNHVKEKKMPLSVMIMVQVTYYMFVIFFNHRVNPYHFIQKKRKSGTYYRQAHTTGFCTLLWFLYCQIPDSLLSQISKDIRNVRFLW